MFFELAAIQLRLLKHKKNGGKVVKRILVSWIGHTDLKAMSAAVPASHSKAVRKIVGNAVDPKVGIGPIKTLLDQEAFDQVHLVAD